MAARVSRYWFRTFSHGRLGADAVVFRDAAPFWRSPIVQAFGTGDTDRKKAARFAREFIADRKTLDALKARQDEPHSERG